MSYMDWKDGIIFRPKHQIPMFKISMNCFFILGPFSAPYPAAGNIILPFLSSFSCPDLLLTTFPATIFENSQNNSLNFQNLRDIRMNQVASKVSVDYK